MDNNIYIHIFLVFIVLLSLVSFLLIVNYLRKKGEEFLVHDGGDKGIFIDGLTDQLRDNARHSHINNQITNSMQETLNDAQKALERIIILDNQITNSMQETLNDAQKVLERIIILHNQILR